jgi:leucyl aminopeptidase
MGSAKTRFSISSERATGVKVDGLVIPVFKKPEDKNAKAKGNNKKNDSDPTANIIWPFALDKALQSEILAIAAEEKFDGSRGKVLTVRQSTGNKLGARRLVVLGLGDAAKLQPKHWEVNLIKALGSLFGLKDFRTVGIALPQADNVTSSAAVALAVDAVFQSTYKSMEAKDPVMDLQKAILLTDDKSNAITNALREAESLAAARSLVKDLVNHPSNLKNTNTLVNQAKTIGKHSLINVTVQDKTEWIKKNMPCFYTVAIGSVATDPPKFIQLRYKPKSGKAKKHIAIVGKSVIFDTGGYQVKPGDYMVTMKGDMTGGAVVLATMQALAELQPENIEVSAYLAATPNKIDSDAMIPDSIVDTTCGKKVEIRHTDAEGRLTLIDAVAKAVENNPEEIITIATLTGSASQAVGYTIALMGNDETLRNRLVAAGRRHGEPIQTLDVVEDDYDNIKSKLDGADIINTSQRKHRGAQSAAAFVMSGAPEDMPMAHMDIAGADMTADEKATGISVKTIIQYLLNENENLSGGAKKSTSAQMAAPKAAAPKLAGTVKTKSSAKQATAKPAKATAQKSTARPKAKAASKPKASAKTAKAGAVQAATVTKKVKPAVKNAPKDRQPPKKAGKSKPAAKPKGK